MLNRICEQNKASVDMPSSNKLAKPAVFVAGTRTGAGAWIAPVSNLLRDRVVPENCIFKAILDLFFLIFVFSIQLAIPR